MTVIFYHAGLSSAISFDPTTSANAETFVSRLLAEGEGEASEVGSRSLALVSTDGELYGHHQPLRQYFLSHLLRVASPARGIEVTTLARYLKERPAHREAQIVSPSSWSCFHGVQRWERGCACTEGESSWKRVLRDALRWLAEQIDAAFEEETAPILTAPWAAEEDYIRVRLGSISSDAFWRRQRRRDVGPESRERVFELLEGQYYRHLMFASCAFYFEDLDRVEPRYAVSYAARAILGGRPERQAALREGFEQRLAEARSWRSGFSGADLLRAAEASLAATRDLAGAA